MRQEVCRYSAEVILRLYRGAQGKNERREKELSLKRISRVRARKIAKWVIIIALILTVIFAAFTIYGSQVGNFVVNVEKENNTNLSLFQQAESEGGSATAELSFPGLADQRPCSSANIPTDIENGMGGKNDFTNLRYIAFSFIVKNTSEVAVDMQMELVINNVTKNVDAAVRVMIIVDGVYYVYAKPKDFPEAEVGQPEVDKIYSITSFAGPATVCRQEFLSMQSGSQLKFTLVTWLEGDDAQCTDDIKGGSIRMEMHFAAR